MTVENLKDEIESNKPFEILMADGRSYGVPHRDFISFTRKQTTVIVSDENDRSHFLPLLTMTGIVRERPEAELSS